MATETTKKNDELPIPIVPSKVGVPTLSVPEKVIVHPLVLLSVVDHYNRVAKNTQKRVVGVLLGQCNTTDKYVNVANSFAVPFEEDEKDPSVWFIDHNYVETMNDMFRKVNAREKMIGWYHTGPKLRSSDLSINELFKRFIKDPVLVVVDVNQGHVGLPTDSYFSIEEVKDDGTPTTRTFMHVPSSVEAEEAEEIGVEHLLRDIKNSQVGTLSSRLQDRYVSLKGLIQHLDDIQAYLNKVVDGRLPIHHAIIYNLQHVFNFLPHVEEQARSFHVQINDQWMVMYIASLIRSVLALHDLIDNKLQNKENEEQSVLNSKESTKKVVQSA